MYFSIGIVLFALLTVIIIGASRRRYALKKLCSMSCKEKCETLNSLIEPFGYCYEPSQDVISSRNNAWQREFGYTALFDTAAPFFNMVFDSLPLYFDYRGRTWLAELWKGQYGINTGAEIGIYYSERILSVQERKTAHFQAVEAQDALPVSMTLIKKDRPLFSLSKITWWLTGFCMGSFSKPGQLCLNTAFQFPNCEMLACFLQALSEAGIPENCVLVCGLQVRLTFSDYPKQHFSWFKRLARFIAGLSNRFYCRLYLLITHRFCLTADKLLYLYYLLPGIFRRTLRLRRYKKKKCRKSKKCGNR